MVLEFITARDYNLMRRLNRWQAPRWVRIWMIAASRAGDGWLWYGTGILILLFGGPMRFAALGAAALAAATGIALFQLVKRGTNRKRPGEFEPHCWATLLPPDRFSFPSGHTITAFSLAMSLSAFYPGLRIPLVFCAASIALSRIVLGMHFLSDVIVGALIGSGLAYGAVRLVR
jgi:undecaprenyl-diphosphatase